MGKIAYGILLLTSLSCIGFSLAALRFVAKIVALGGRPVLPIWIPVISGFLGVLLTLYWGRKLWAAIRKAKETRQTAEAV